MKKQTFEAPAKINLCLHVLGKRADGYHELAMLMQRVSLFDHIEIALTDRPGVQVRCAGVELPPGGENIAAKAARRMLEISGCPGGVDIAIDKQIPVAAGLGGGSSDAATVLMGLNAMLGVNLDRQRLMEEGGRLGADVPFFIFKATAWATGVGDVLEEVEGVPRLWYVLVNPGVAVSTAWVYKNLGLTTPGAKARMPGLFDGGHDLVRLFHNDLERVTVGAHPVVAEVKERLLRQGALGALMSGSGPTVFGAFGSEDAARAAARNLAEKAGWRSFVVHPL